MYQHNGASIFVYKLPLPENFLFLKLPSILSFWPKEHFQHFLWAGLIENHFNAYLSGNLFISPSILKDNFARYCVHFWRFFFSSALWIHYPTPLVCNVSAAKSADNFLGAQAYVTNHFSLAWKDFPCVGDFWQLGYNASQCGCLGLSSLDFIVILKFVCLFRSSNLESFWPLFLKIGVCPFLVSCPVTPVTHTLVLLMMYHLDSLPVLHSFFFFFPIWLLWLNNFKWPVFKIADSPLCFFLIQNL